MSERYMIVGPETINGTIHEIDNINGPCLTRVPSWVSPRLGTYYLYFGHHTGTYIRMVYADHLQGPWTIYKGGVLDITQLSEGTHHVSSPEVIWHEESQTCRLYVHAPLKSDRKQQRTFLFCGSDGLHFKEDSQMALCPSYLRLWFHTDGMWYGLVRGGQLFRSADGKTAPFEEGPQLFGTESKVRHVGIYVRAQDNSVTIYGTSIGHRPEHIWACELDTSHPDWRLWSVGPIAPVLSSLLNWEGADLPLQRSRSGRCFRREHALRDPYVFVERDKTYLIYAAAGESALGLTLLNP